MSETKRGKYDGKNNPTYGSCWITKDGWIKGRKIKKI